MLLNFVFASLLGFLGGINGFMITQILLGMVATLLTGVCFGGYVFITWLAIGERKDSSASHE